MRNPYSAIWQAWIPLLLAAAAGAQQTTAVSPQARSRLEGNASTYYPLGRAKARFQQLYGDLGQGQLIKGHAYRRDALTSRGQVAAFQTEMAVSLSRAALTPDKAQKTFAQNAGASPTTVLGRTTLSFPATSKPTGLAPAPFLLRVPYKTPFGWDGKGTLCLEMVLHGNKTTGGQDKNFTADLDGHQLFSSGRSEQPSIPYGQGCTAKSAKNPAQATFLVRHLGKTSDLRIDVTNGVPTTSSNAAQSVLVVGPGQRNQAWPPATGCTLYTDSTVIVFLAGNNDANGGWSGTLPLGPPVAPYSSMFAQAASLDQKRGELVLTNGARLTMPPASPGLISARIAHGTDPAASAGTVSYSVPVTLFF
jgi:hypothetical protein